ncbi:MAG: phage terminase large subunit family protein [Planctomycetota bacterium]|jgi:phage FluMu gp28-like protein
MLIVAKRTPRPDEYRRWLATTPGFIQAATRVDDRRTRLAPYQVRHLRDGSKFRACEKARGVGFSFICAAEALARAHLCRGDYTAIFVSINLEEAVEKVRYANMLYDSMPLAWRKKKVVDNKTAVEFVDSTGRRRSRLISHPCKDPRGRHKADVYLDEFAHYGHKQRAIYVASVPVVSRGDRQLTIGSTPLVAGDLFHEIMHPEGKKRYEMFSRQSVPWWLCPDLCTDVRRARAEAPAMDTASRIEAFARPTLADIFHSLDVGEFRQEYELAFPDESQTYFPYELIFSCVSDELTPAASVDRLFASTKGDLYAGFDVGRTRNTSELVVLERKPKRLIYRYGRSFDRSRFKDQEAHLRKMLRRSRRLKRLCIDRHGIGMNMAENLHSEFRSSVEGVAMIGPVKESLAVGLHIVLENEEISIPRDRELIAQVHSIKKSSTNAGYSRYDTETNAKAHADVLWALALAVHAAGITRERKRRRKAVSASIV